MAVSKAHPVEAILGAVEAGMTLFGENHVQEFERKRPELAHLTKQIEVHLIGHLQSNKSAKAAEIFSAVDTLDTVRLAERLNEAAQKLNRTLPLLLEIKLSSEATKAGLDPQGRELGELLDRVPDLSHLAVCGVMTIPPLDDNPDTTRNCFQQLRRLRDRLASHHPALDLSQLSMGMSGDFEIAIEEGSTMVRIGTALFGVREVRV